MKWITRENVRVDRVACPWLIKKFVDQNAEFYFVPSDRVLKEAERLGAIPFDAPGVELGHHETQALVSRCPLSRSTTGRDTGLHCGATTDQGNRK